MNYINEDNHTGDNNIDFNRIRSVLPTTLEEGSYNYSLENLANNRPFKVYKIYFIPLVLFLKWIFYGYMFIFKDSSKINDVSSPNYKPFWFGVFSECDECIDIRNQCWRLLSYSVLHTNFYHLLFNTISLLIFGGLLEYITGRVVIIVFINTVIFGAISIGYSDPYAILVGSSGGVYGVLGGGFGVSLVNLNILSKISLVSIFIVFLLTLVINLHEYFYHRSTNTAYEVHLIGFIYGFLISISIVKPHLVTQYHKYARMLSILILIVTSLWLLYQYISLDSAKHMRYREECCYIG